MRTMVIENNIVNIGFTDIEILDQAIMQIMQFDEKEHAVNDRIKDCCKEFYDNFISCCSDEYKYLKDKEYKEILDILDEYVSDHYNWRDQDPYIEAMALIKVQFELFVYERLEEYNKTATKKISDLTMFKWNPYWCAPSAKDFIKEQIVKLGNQNNKEVTAMLAALEDIDPLTGFTKVLVEIDKYAESKESIKLLDAVQYQYSYFKKLYLIEESK